MTPGGMARCIVAMAGLLPAASACATAGDLRFETIASEKGLAENTVKAIAEDAQGFLWFGTENGNTTFWMANRAAFPTLTVFRAQRLDHPALDGTLNAAK